MNNVAIYIHWPFCLSKCPYCDFNSRVMPQGEDQQLWASRYIQALRSYAALLSERQISSIYFGGGTPSLMEAEIVEKILHEITSLWRVNKDCEITLEANPTSSESQKFEAFKKAGVNRLSLGAQSLNDKALQFLGRTHDATQAKRAIGLAAKTFDRFSFDLIYARAGQSMVDWEEELKEALSFSPRHLSLYQLTLEEGSVFYKRPDREALVLEDGLAADMFHTTNDRMAEAGLPAYEVSNYAAAGQESRHNLTYWEYQDYIGIGPGAHGRFVDESGRRWATEEDKNPATWIAHPQNSQQEISRDDARIEAFMMGLRLTHGINKYAWKSLFDEAIDENFDQKSLARLEKQGLVLNTEQNIAITEKGRIYLDVITAQLLA